MLSHPYDSKSQELIKVVPCCGCSKHMIGIGHCLSILRKLKEGVSHLVMETLLRSLVREL